MSDGLEKPTSHFLQELHARWNPIVMAGCTPWLYGPRFHAGVFRYAWLRWMRDIVGGFDLVDPGENGLMLQLDIEQFAAKF